MTRTTSWRRPTRPTGAAVLLCLVLAACDTGRTTVVWAEHVPSPAPELVENQPVVARGPNTITLMPISPRGAVVGVAYGYDMPHCGIKSPIDVDGTFWDAIGIAPDSVDFDGVSGTFRLISPMEAVFTRSDGPTLDLVRHTGPKAFPSCD